MPNIKQQFIKDILLDEGRRLIRNQGIEIEKRLQFHTHRLFNDRTMDVSNAGEMGAELSITFPAYLRFLDIKSLDSGRRDTARRKAKQGYRIYNRFAMGHYYSIANRVSVDFTEAVAQNISNTFNTTGNGN